MKNKLILLLAVLAPSLSFSQEMTQEKPLTPVETPRKKATPARINKTRFSASLTVENTLGMNPTLAVYYSFPRKPWNLGLKYRHISTTISDIKLNGAFIGIEAQRYIWHKSRFQVWGSGEIGIVNTDMDLSHFSTTESKIKKSEPYFALGADLRYNLTNRLRLTGGLSVFHDSLNKRFDGDSGSYKLETKPFHLGYRVGLLYFF